MEIITIFLYVTLAPFTEGKLEPYNEPYCPPRLAYIRQVDTIYLDMDGYFNMDLKGCLLKNIHYATPVILAKGYLTQHYNKSRPLITNDDPNVLMTTSSISAYVLNSPSVKEVLKSHRSLVFIVITDKDRFKCENGNLAVKDFFSLEIFMNLFWHNYKIPHVIITFPLTCRTKFVVYSDKLVNYTNKIVYDRTLVAKDFIDTEGIYTTISKAGKLLTDGYPLKASIFYRFPTSIKECKNLHYYTKISLDITKGHCGLDALVMHDIVKHFKFKVYFPKNENCNKYGYRTSNNLTGSLGCIVRKELDISFNSRFMAMYSEDYIYFLHYIATDSLCVLVKEADLIPIWRSVVDVFNPELRIFVILVTVIVGIFMWTMSVVKQLLTGIKRESLCLYILDAFTLTLFGFSVKKKRELYILCGTCFSCSILFVAIYQGHVNHVFTTLLRFETIKTLNALYRSDHTLYVSPSIKSLVKQFQRPENTLQSQFLKRSRKIMDGYMLDFILKHPRAALVGRKQDTFMEVLHHYTDEYGKPLINIVDECFYTYSYLSYIARSGFPFYEELQRFMMSITQAGLPIIYHKWTCHMLGVPESLPKVHNEARPFAKIKLQDERIAFGILFLGHVISIFVFFIELWRGRRNHLVVT